MEQEEGCMVKKIKSDSWDKPSCWHIFGWVEFLQFNLTMDLDMTSATIDQGSIPSRGRDFLFTVMSRPAMRPTQLPIQWVAGAFLWG